MKIPNEIWLLCKDVKVYVPWWQDIKQYCEERPIDSSKFRCIGVKGIWHPDAKAFYVPSVLHPSYGWKNIYTDKSRWTHALNEREDAVFNMTSFEEVAMKLELDGEKFVFEVPQKVVKWREDDMSRLVGHSDASFFTMSFKMLREKCRRIC